jgi:hypothetical protein
MVPQEPSATHAAFFFGMRSGPLGPEDTNEKTIPSPFRLPL